MQNPTPLWESLKKVLEYVEESEHQHYDEWIAENPDKNPAEHIYHISANIYNKLFR